MKKILPFFLLVLLLASCQKDPDMSKLSDDFVVFTDHNKDANGGGIRDITGGMATGVTGLAHGMDGIIRILLYTAIA